MGRTLPSITQSLSEEQSAYTRFRRALRRSDQLALDELFVAPPATIRNGHGDN